MELTENYMGERIYEAVYGRCGRRYEFKSNERLKPLDVCFEGTGKIVIVVKVKPISEKNYHGILARLKKITKLEDL